jgi:hypothetical protein
VKYEKGCYLENDFDKEFIKVLCLAEDFKPIDFAKDLENFGISGSSRMYAVLVLTASKPKISCISEETLDCEFSRIEPTKELLSVFAFVEDCMDKKGVILQ